MRLLECPTTVRFVNARSQRLGFRAQGLEFRVDMCLRFRVDMGLRFRVERLVLLRCKDYGLGFRVLGLSVYRV